MENLLKIERKIYSPIKTKQGYKLRSNQEIYEKLDELQLAITKSSLNFYGYTVIKDQKRLNNQIFDKIFKNKGITLKLAVHQTN